MGDTVTLGALRRLKQPTFQNLALAPSTAGGYSLFYESVTDSITAHAGGGQTNATQLVSELNRITTVATAGDSVVLPPTTQYPSSGDAYQIGSAVMGIGQSIMVINHGANAMQVYGSGTDTINDVATATGVSQMPNSMVIYICTIAGKWYSQGLGEGYSGSFMTLSSIDSITAHAGGGQGSATALTAMINRVTTVATAADSVVLPASAPGMNITIINAAAANSMNLFPASGDKINALATNAAFAIAAGKTVEAYCCAAGQWHTILSA